MKSLRRILLANNGFTGKILTSLVGIPKLVELQLQDNKFDGSIPAFAQQDFQLNVANNRLEGPIPPQLSSQSLSSFEVSQDKKTRLPRIYPFTFWTIVSQDKTVTQQMSKGNSSVTLKNLAPPLSRGRRHRGAVR
ncbi:hypothetical protein RND71_042562 [Anisodus tanguticus]|uniref:Uncharacterized protein n=1 Tax=Anisodus tanguticus TaxID=243964 RepID=A0AAE1QQW1_9SOLA|nr:hypothetical protein RND71_042562 [Anisodus tanguticus]